jgi:PAS domain S-box-containing protein
MDFADVADHAPVLIWVIGPRGEGIYFNEPWLGFTGLPVQNQQEDGWLQAVHPDDRERLLAIYRGSNKGHAPFQTEIRLRRADDVYRWMLGTGVPRLDDQGRFCGYVGSCVDVTEHREAKEALRRSEQRYRSLFDLSLDAVFSVDAQGRFTSVNPAAERLSGYSAQELCQMTFPSLCTPDWLDRTMADFGRAMRGESLSAESAITARDGHRVDLLVRSVPIVVDGQVIGIFGVAEDITHRKAAEAALRESHENLRQLNEALEERVRERTCQLQRQTNQLQLLAKDLTEAEQVERRRLAELLHDHLQQLLVAVKLNLSILTQPRRSQAEATNRVQRSLAAIEEAIGLTRDLSAELSPPILNAGGLNPATRWLAQQMQRMHGLTVGVHWEEGLPNQQGTVAEVLFAAARELLFNVVKHAGVKEADLHLRRADGMIELVVADRGCGLSPQAAAGDAPPQWQDGFGLGHIRRKVESLGGRLSISSPAGGGAIACVRLAGASMVDDVATPAPAS